MAIASSPNTFDATLPKSLPDIALPAADACCSLVQIYPTNILAGLVKLSGTVTLGREPDNHIQLADASVSRHHACLEWMSDGYQLKDLGSTNGTFVNDCRVSQCKLHGDETIRIGSFIFKFLPAGGIEAHYHTTVYSAMTRDGLTGAFNKSFLLDALDHEIARSYRSMRPMSVLILDIDHFKKINDTYGHLVGDEVLREFARRLNDSRRQDDLLCRYGGEEFVMILSETNSPDAKSLAERCRLAIADQPIETSAGAISVTVSIGTTELLLDDQRLSRTQLLEQADQQLYQAKKTGRNRVC